MKYHDNHVLIKFKSDTGEYKLIGGKYCIIDAAVSPGQDPDENLKKEKIFSFGNDGDINIRVGRHKTKEVAEWWKERIEKNFNTFYDDPDELNFAMIGNLTMEIEEISSQRIFTLYYEQVALAQGHSGTRNNWWLGCPFCYRTVGNDDLKNSDEQISMYAKGNEQVRNDYFLTTAYRSKRGSSVNTIDWHIVRRIGTENADWMERYFNNGENLNTALKDMVLPGSHDSGMSELHHLHILAGLNKDAVKTQRASVFEQLLYGCRYFDLRIDHDHGELVTYHRVGFDYEFGDIGANGQSLRDVMEQAIRFLQEYPGETFIFKFSHTRNCEDHDPDKTNVKILEYLKKSAALFYKDDKETSVYLHDVTYEKLRGKIIIACDFVNGKPEEGLFDYDDAGLSDHKDGKWRRANKLVVIDKYSNTSDLDKMSQDQLDKLDTYSKLDSPYALFLLSWTLTAGVCDSIKDLSKRANEELIKRLNARDTYFNKCNIVYVDYIDYVVCDSIIQLNKK